MLLLNIEIRGGGGTRGGHHRQLVVLVQVDGLGGRGEGLQLLVEPAERLRPLRQQGRGEVGRVPLAHRTDRPGEVAGAAAGPESGQRGGAPGGLAEDVEQLGGDSIALKKGTES